MTTSNDFDPETARLTALTALRAWARQRDRQPAERAALVASAWQAGERNLRELARIGDVSRTTIYDDLRGQGIEPAVDRDAPREIPKPTLLTHEVVSDLAERMAAALLPSMVGPVTEPLAAAAWTAQQVIATIGRLLDPKPPADFDRATWLDSLAAYGDHIRRDAHRQWAAEATDVELARFTENARITAAELNIAAIVESATLTLLTLDGMTKTQIEISTAGHGDTAPEGWTTWRGDVALDGVDRFRHLESAALLAALSEVVTPALPVELMNYDE